MSGKPQPGQGRRAAFVLAAAQAILGSANPIAVSIGALAGYYLLAADKSLATLPVTGMTIGVALGAMPAAMIVRHVGQRAGFLVGAATTGAGGALAALGLLRHSFWLFVLGLLVIGLGGAFVQQFRFAAADTVAPAYKARAISIVLAGGVITAIVGPQIVIFTRELLAPVMFAGSFVAVIGLAVIGAVILLFLPPRPVKTSTISGFDELPARKLGEIVRQPRFFVGLICAVGSYAMMSFVMTGAPLAMVGCGFSPDEATLGISWHVMAMFGPSFFTGRLIARFGAEMVVAAGLLLLIACGVVALSGLELWQFWSALVLLGVGWNFGFIGATAMVASTYRPSEQGKALSLHDTILFGTVALASFMSGVVLENWGWETLNLLVFPVMALCLGALAMLRLAGRKSEDVAAG